MVTPNAAGSASAGAGVAIITGHPFIPRGEWWTVCLSCGLAEAAHAKTTLSEFDRRYPKTAAAWRTRQ